MFSHGTEDEKSNSLWMIRRSHVTTIQQQQQQQQRQEKKKVVDTQNYVLCSGTLAGRTTVLLHCREWPA
jgi:1,2-phenylacetyl-CoA epoxidase PaaB subunit